MDEWIVKCNPTPQEFFTLVNAGEYLPRPYAAVKEELDKVLTGRTSRLAMRNAVELVWDDLCMRGTPYNCSFGMFLVEGKTANELIQIREGHPSWQSLMARYGIEAHESNCNALGKDIGVRATGRPQMFKLINALFGCSHTHYSFPRTVKSGQRRPEAAAITGTYVVCLDCGKEFAYDWQQMKVIFSSKPKPVSEAVADSFPPHTQAA